MNLRRSIPLLVAVVCGVAVLFVAARPTPGTSISVVARPTPSASTTVRYTADTTSRFANPERGFYHHTETHLRADGTGYTPLDLATLRSYRENEQITLILRVFYLETFQTTDRLDASFLRRVSDDFTTIRQAGLKAVVRFAYAQPAGEYPYNPPYNDAPAAHVEAHIEQLTPVLRANSDVIATAQVGFVGLWGEWYYTDHFVTDPSDPASIGEQDWANRKAVMDGLLAALPVTRTVQLRTPTFKRTLYGANALTAAEAYGGSARARVGHHNDCFLASSDDYGTYSDPAVEYPYLATDSSYLPVGGETCAVNPPRSDCTTAVAEMSRFHWSYLNIDYNRDVIDPWATANPPCMDDVQRLLGYRFTVKEAMLPTSAKAGQTVAVRIALVNDGWASPYNPRDVELVLRGTNGTVRRFALDADPRRWKPGENVAIAQNLTLPNDLPPDTYQLFLNLPDPTPRLRGIAAYSIRMANTGTWEAATGYNKLNVALTVPR